MPTMAHPLEQLREDALAQISSAPDERALEAMRVKFLGRGGSVTQWSDKMKSLPKEEKPVIGKLLNEIRTAVTAAIETRAENFRAEKESAAVANIDISLPGTSHERGAIHPLTQMLDRSIGVFRRMGFALAEGPDIETEWHCFDALNTPADHPARNEKDTFYLSDGRLLRTHTSTVQIRTMETAKALPVRIIAPGAAYRRDEIDATHLSVFNQLEGLYVDRQVSLADLKGTLEFFFQEIFGAGTQVRFRPHYFPFTEPSYEIDIKLEAKGQEAKWIEIAGCGMVDPTVFESVSQTRGDKLFDPEGVTGFAFGLGLDRLAMILHGITDIRHLIENDVRFLAQF